MNNKLSITCFVLVAARLFIGCSEPVQKETNNNKPASAISSHVGDERYVVVDTESVVSWKSSNSFDSHAGYVYISKGELMIKNSQLIGGTVEVDMNTIEDDNHDRNNGLIIHLKDPDFFDVKKFPFASIAITSVATINAENKQITGNLTIKGITHPVSFPAKIELKDGAMKATGKLVIDRTKWGVRYGSGKFFDNLKERVISDDIEFNMKIVAKTKQPNPKRL
jgi:polyisoprenoid-binding protein YceI